MTTMESRWFDPVSGLAAAVLMGGIVWFINQAHGPWPATTAALKQAGYTFLMGGAVTQLCRHLAARPWQRWIAVAVATIVPSAITILATFGVHSLKGTPEPVLSTVPVMLLSPPVFGYWSLLLTRKVS